MTTSTQVRIPEVPAKAHPFAPPHSPPVVSRPKLTGKPEIDDDLDELRVAHYLLSEHEPFDCYEDLGGKSPAVRRYLSGANLADGCFIRTPLLRDLDESEKGWPPHYFSPRTHEARKAYPNPDECLESRKGLALEYLTEATGELRDFVTSNDLENNRLIHAVATAIRGEIRRLVAFIDAGFPSEYGEPEVKKDPIATDPSRFTHVIEQLSGKQGRPSSLVDEMLTGMDYTVEVGPLGVDCPFVVDPRKRLVTLAPGMKPDERAFQLARVVALIRICLYDLDTVGDAAENQRAQDHYVRQLLLPDVQVRDYIASHEHVNEKALVKAVAESFGVPKRLVKARLTDLQLILPEKVRAA